jgi:hypothetical protein
MNPRKIPRNTRNNIDPNQEEKTSTNMSIDEDSILNDKDHDDHPLCSNKNYFNSFNINRVSNILANNIIQIPINDNVYNTQKRPTTTFSFYSNSELGVEDSYEHLGTNSAFTSKKRKKSKKTAKNKKNSNLNYDIKEDIEEDEADLTSGNLTTNKLLNEIIRSFNTFNYSDYELKHYFDDNHLNLTRKTDPYIELKVLCTSENVDLRCVPNSYIIGENGLNCSMKNHNRDVTTIGRQQINQDMIRPNDIMLFPTDSSLSRCHLTIYHKNFFDEIKKYKIDVDTTIRISRKSKFSSLPQQIWYGIIHFLKPRLCLEIQDQGTIYGSYVKINEMSVFNLLINAYILLSDSRGDLFSFFKSDFMYSNSINNNKNSNAISNMPFVSGNIDQINAMPINQVLQKIHYELKKSSTMKICNYIKDYLNKNLNNIINNPYGEEFSYETLFNQTNKILKNNQFFLTSSHSGLIVENIGNLGQILQNIFIKYNNYQNMYQNSDSVNQISASILSIGKIYNSQKIEPNSKIHIANYNSILELPSINTFEGFLNEKAIQLIETEGDPCGIMNHIRIIILVDTFFRFPDNSKVFSLLFQRGFIFGKNKYACLHCPLLDCNIFIYYSIQAKCWAINEVSNLLNNSNSNNNNRNNNNFINEQYFGLYLCTSDDKGYDDRFKQKKYCVKQGDKIKISDTVLEVRFHL